MYYIIGLDLGTTNCKAIALTESGEVLASSSSAYNLYSPKPGWVEQIPEEVWLGVQKALGEINVSNLPGDLAGICLSGAMHSIVPIGYNNQVLTQAMTWADQRASEQAKRLRNATDTSSIYKRTGCPLQSIYHCPKILWWYEEEPEIAKQTAKFVAIKDFISYQLTGEWFTDRGLASTTGLLDIHQGEWDLDILDLVNINKHKLPDLRWPSEKIGTLTSEASVLTLLPKDTLIVAGTHDGGLANIGAGASSNNNTVITVGTSGAVRRFVDLPVLDPQERTWCYITQRSQWLAGGAINNGGLAIQWIKDRFYSEISESNGYAHLFTEAALIPPGAEGLLFLPYFTGERSPLWDSSIRASISGLSLRHQRSHIARAALEGVAFCLADVTQALDSAQSHSPTKNEIIRLTGGITQSTLWVQILSDVLGTQIMSVEIADASAIGAAMLGHQALGLASLTDLTASVPPGVLYSPNPENHIIYKELHQQFQKKYTQLK